MSPFFLHVLFKYLVGKLQEGNFPLGFGVFFLVYSFGKNFEAQNHITFV